MKIVLSSLKLEVIFKVLSMLKLIALNYTVIVTGRTRRETCGSIFKLYSKAWLQNKQGSFNGKQEQHRQDKE